MGSSVDGLERSTTYFAEQPAGALRVMVSWGPSGTSWPLALMKLRGQGMATTPNLYQSSISSYPFNIFKIYATSCHNMVFAIYDVHAAFRHAPSVKKPMAIANANEWT